MRYIYPIQLDPEPDGSVVNFRFRMCRAH
jgi:hypothetical protein